ncbi:hypothetical protein PVAP13_1NG341019 [Panicum virgatum]|uniref:Uncharacterized protein n=1 Tax=Panicum virgatum TaxID=38727 RepID=A0A8T0WRM0_PANVG|nr:hypothetical protein PVAP13_1NG341019 [Panicum virgatum]
MLSSLASALSLCTVGKRVDGGSGGQGQHARRSSSAQDAGTAAVAARSTAVLLHSDGGSRGRRPRQPLPAAADASARPRLLAGCATAWQPRPAVVAIPPSPISTAGARDERRRCDAWDSALSCSLFQFPSMAAALADARAAGRRRDWPDLAASCSARGGGSRIWRPRRPAREVAAPSSSSVAAFFGAPSSPPPSWPAAVAGSRTGPWRGAGARQAAGWSGGGSSSRRGGETPRPGRRGGGCEGGGRGTAG